MDTETFNLAFCSTCEEGCPAEARSYECNFCKRGFSNAQALGGHMNIHRRDKAKLKHAPSQGTQPLPKKAKTPTTNWPWSSSSQAFAGSTRETLPFFAEANPNNSHPEHHHGYVSSHGPGNGFFFNTHESGSGLDLELRLGSAMTATRNFF
ncbi:hypothetical protein NMG60_11034109 [Bertholletia excelsa]